LVPAAPCLSKGEGDCLPYGSIVPMALSTGYSAQLLGRRAARLVR